MFFLLKKNLKIKLEIIFFVKSPMEKKTGKMHSLNITCIKPQFVLVFYLIKLFHIYGTYNKYNKKYKYRKSNPNTR